MLSRLRSHQAWQFFSVLGKVSRPLTWAWWALLVLRGLLPALAAVSIGALVSAVSRGVSLAAPLVFVGSVFIALQLFMPLQQAIGASLGSRTSGWLNDRLMSACLQPPGIGHLERPELTNDLSMARDFDLGITGPPLSISMDFIANGLVALVAGFAAAAVLVRYHWWAAVVLVAAWGSTHWLLKESGVWKDRNTDEVRNAQRHADYAYRLAVDAPAAKELRLFGLGSWVIDRFVGRRRRLYELQWQATRLRERSVLAALAVVAAGNLLVFWSLARDAADGRLSLAATVVFLQTAAGVNMIAFGELSWALDTSAAPVAAVTRLQAAMAPAGALAVGVADAAGTPARHVRLRDVTFRYPGGPRDVLDGFDLTIPAGTSMAIVGVNGAGKTTLAKLLCRLYDPQGGSIEIDGTDLRAFEITSWRSRIAAVFQDFVRFELSLRDNVAPGGRASEEMIDAALAEAGASGLADLDTPLARGYAGGTDLSGGQWQRVALARALAAVRAGAGIVLLDEPTAQLDVRGEAEIFERVLAATRQCTTILISHRFSTVRHADRICVVEHGKVVELGSHDELMALGGRYRTMFDMQASRFVELTDEGEEVVYDSLS